MTDRRRAPIEVLERLAEAADRYVGFHNRRMLSNDGEALAKACDDYRAAVAPLRTRAEVDGDMCRMLRTAHSLTWQSGNLPRGSMLVDLGSADRVERFHELFNEKTNSGPSSADTEEVPSPRPPVSPAGGLFFDEDLIRRAMDPTVPPGHMRLIISRGAVDVLIEPSGPAGAAAAKESKDNAAAPEGAANDRECNCDQALHLERRIGDAVRAIRRSSTIPAGLLHELLGILEGEA